MHKRIIKGWGGYPKVLATCIEPAIREVFAHTIKTHSKLIVRGNGRSYGDSALQETVLSTRQLNTILHFDKGQGIIQCESGVLLEQVIKEVLPNGFFLPVTPGTKYITVGGAVAANVHGKNHVLAGSFSNHVLALELMTADGGIVTCSPNENSDLFEATLGGMGLTGLILSVTFALRPIQTAYVLRRNIAAPNLSRLLELFDEQGAEEHTVAWIDAFAGGRSIGRGIFTMGKHANLSTLPKKFKDPLTLHRGPAGIIPTVLPGFLLNDFSVRAYNHFYFLRAEARKKEEVVHYDPFFYPLDAWKHWNRLYGSRGMVQYQFVVPVTHAQRCIEQVLSEISRFSCYPYLAVLKKLGSKDANVSSLSFPEPGYTLALDFKVSRKTFELLDQLDEKIIAFGGKLYLCKDARMSSETFHKTYHNCKFTSPFISMQFERLC
jgi:decaprenylphospho-beta-D-ribofuranose 2-oxidase